MPSMKSPISAAILLVALVTAVVAVSVANPPRTPISRGSLQIRGADISFTLQEEAAGNKLSAQGRVLPVEQILAANGANYVRLRVWLDPPPGYSDEASALQLARRAKKAGLKLLLNLHYSDFWADPRNQVTPVEWRADDLPALEARVRDYTRRVVREFAAQGTPVDIVQIGNEVSNGMLWPVGEIYRQGGEDWTGFAALLASGMAGAREGDTQHPPSLLIHFDHGGDNLGARHFFDKIMEAGVTSFDAIGLSYYPFWHGPLSNLQANLDDLADRYQKDLVVVETSYPWTLAGDSPGRWVTDIRQLPDAAAFPPTARGQELYFRALRRVLRQVPDDRGIGFFAWEPGWLAGVGSSPGAPNPGVNLTMFDARGRMLPALAAAFTPPSPDPPR